MLSIIVPGLLFGLLAGFSMGLSGAGGALLLIPSLTYGLSISLDEAMSLSLIAVIISAGIGFFLSLRLKKHDLRESSSIILGGILSSPLGSYSCTLCLPRWQQLAFATLILIAAFMMWFHEDLFYALARPPTQKKKADTFLIFSSDLQQAI